MIQQILAIWLLVPLHFLKPAWTSESSWFTYCWSHFLFLFKHFIFIFNFQGFFGVVLWMLLLLLCNIFHGFLRCFHSSSVSSVQLFSCVQLLATPWTAACQAFPVHHQLPELAQTHVHWVGDAIEPSHPLSSPAPPAFNLSQHQSLFKWVTSLHQVAKVLELPLQYQSFQWIFRTDFL